MVQPPMQPDFPRQTTITMPSMVIVRRGVAIVSETELKNDISSTLEEVAPRIKTVPKTSTTQSAYKLPLSLHNLDVDS